MRKEKGAEERWTYGAYYLDQPHPDRGGSWYACRYDTGSGTVHRRSLRTTDFEQAKQKLVALAAVAPVPLDAAPGPRDVLTTAVLDAYASGHATTIASEALVIRASVLVVEYLRVRGSVSAPVSFWTPARQLDFAGYLHEKHKHVPATIHRFMTVLNAAFQQATKSIMRPDALGEMVEGSLLSHRPKFELTQAEIAKQLRIVNTKKQTFVPSMQEMARFIDAIETPHVRRWIVIALATWARPEAVTDFDPDTQWDRRTDALDLNPPGRVQNNKRRSSIVCCRTLAGCVDIWRAENSTDHERAKKREGDPDLPRSNALLVYKRKRVHTVKKAVKRIADDVSLPDITQKTPRTFMSTTVRKLCPGVSREQRSLWMGHTVKEGSRTTEHYEIDDHEYHADTALATDFVLQQIRSLCKTDFAIEVLLNRSELKRIGAKVATISRGK